MICFSRCFWKQLPWAASTIFMKRAQSATFLCFCQGNHALAWDIVWVPLSSSWLCIGLYIQLNGGFRERCSSRIFAETSSAIVLMVAAPWVQTGLRRPYLSSTIELISTLRGTTLFRRLTKRSSCCSTSSTMTEMGRSISRFVSKFPWHLNLPFRSALIACIHHHAS